MYLYACSLLSILQEIAVKETFMEQRVRVGLHCVVGGLMHLLSRVIDIPTLQNHVEVVCALHTYILYICACIELFL